MDSVFDREKGSDFDRDFDIKLVEALKDAKGFFELVRAVDGTHKLFGPLISTTLALSVGYKMGLLDRPNAEATKSAADAVVEVAHA
jgi:hypothetical protein